MKFDYPELSAVPFKGRRFYETPANKFYPSITTILGGTVSKEKEASLKKWQMSLGMDAAQKKTQEAADRGTAVHLLAERHLKKEDLFQGQKFNAADVSMFNGLKLKLNKITEVWGQEVALFSDMIEVAGRCDVIGVYKDKPSIIDFKTSTRLKSDSMIEDYKLQLCAYAIMHNEMFGTDIDTGVILMSSEGGFPQEFIIHLPDFVGTLVDRVDLFYEKLNAEVL